PPANLLMRPLETERLGQVGHQVTPGTHQCLARHRQPLEQGGGHAAVGIEPAVDYVDGTPDLPVVGGDGAALPVRVVALMRGPPIEDGRRGFEALVPFALPLGARDLRIGWRTHVYLEV